MEVTLCKFITFLILRVSFKASFSGFGCPGELRISIELIRPFHPATGLLDSLLLLTTLSASDPACEMPPGLMGLLYPTPRGSMSEAKD